MKVEYAPLIISASGRMGGVVATRWRGIPLFRRFQTPSQPRTPDQVSIRNHFRNANRLYSISPTNARISWGQYSDTRPSIARNGFIGAMGSLAITDTDLANLVPYYPAGGPPSVDEATGVVSSGDITFTRPAFTVPEGWTPSNWLSYAIADFNPSIAQNRSDLQWHEEEVAWTATGTDSPASITGLDAGAYLVGSGLISERDSDPGVDYVGIVSAQILTIT